MDKSGPVITTEAGRRALSLLGGTDDTDYSSPTANLIASIEHEAAEQERSRIVGLAPDITKAVFKEVPLCTGCDFDHSWDDHVRSVFVALIEGSGSPEPVTPEYGGALVNQRFPAPEPVASEETR